MKGAPKIGMVIPAVSKGMISSRNAVHSAGSASRVVVGSTAHGSQGAIKTTQPLGA